MKAVLRIGLVLASAVAALAIMFVGVALTESILHGDGHATHQSTVTRAVPSPTVSAALTPEESATVQWVEAIQAPMSALASDIDALASNAAKHVTEALPENCKAQLDDIVALDAASSPLPPVPAVASAFSTMIKDDRKTATDCVAAMQVGNADLLSRLSDDMRRSTASTQSLERALSTWEVAHPDVARGVG